jgi:hypothetical protein
VVADVLAGAIVSPDGLVVGDWAVTLSLEFVSEVGAGAYTGYDSLSSDLHEKRPRQIITTGNMFLFIRQINPFVLNGV